MFSWMEMFSLFPPPQPKLFIEHIPYSRYCSRFWRLKAEQDSALGVPFMAPWPTSDFSYRYGRRSLASSESLQMAGVLLWLRLGFLGAFSPQCSGNSFVPWTSAAPKCGRVNTPRSSPQLWGWELGDKGCSFLSPRRWFWAALCNFSGSLHGVKSLLPTVILIMHALISFFFVSLFPLPRFCFLVSHSRINRRLPSLALLPGEPSPEGAYTPVWCLPKETMWAT